MARKFKFCLHCRRTITESMVTRGEFVKTKYGYICTSCAERLGEEQEAQEPSAPVQEPEKEAAPPSAPSPTFAEPKPPVVEVKPEPPKEAPASAPELPSIEQITDPTDLLSAIGRHVEAIHRIITFEKSSPWNVLATVTQCLAAGVLLIALFNWIEGPQNLLMVALVLQVMALTFFVKGK